MTAQDTKIYRKALQAHCYRMLGTAQDAEDAVQETMIRAWKGRDHFAATGSVRNWLYRIATNVCLSTLARRPNPRRSVPQLSGPSTTQLPGGEPVAENLWLEPYPDGLLDAVSDTAPGPHARYEMREATRLAFVAAIHFLPPRQRAALLLCDVLGWSSAETADALETSIASVNSALQRARGTLRKKLPQDDSRIPRAVADAAQRQLLDRYVRAWESFDLDGFVSLLKEDAVFSMPPQPEWYRGRDAIRALLAWAWEATGYREFRLVPSGANGQPAFALYGRPNKSEVWEAHAIHVLTLDDGGIVELTNFLDAALFPLFGLTTSSASG